MAVLWEEKEGKKTRSMLLECLGNDRYYKQLLWFLKHCFLSLCFHLKWEFSFLHKTASFLHRCECFCEIFWKTNKRHFPVVEEWGICSLSTLLSFDQLHQREREKRKRLKNGHIFDREVWMLVSVWASRSCLKACMNMNHLWCIFHPERQDAVGYLYKAVVPLVHTHK